MAAILAVVIALKGDMLKLMEKANITLNSRLLCKDFIIKPQGSFLYTLGFGALKGWV